MNNKRKRLYMNFFTYFPKEYKDYCEKLVHTIVNELQMEFI